MTTRRDRYLDFRQELHECGYLRSQLKELVWFNFDSLAECADYLGCCESSVKRWINTNKWPVPIARLLLIKHRSFLPTSKEWRGFRISDNHLTTPYGKSIHVRDLALLHEDFRTKTNYPVNRFRQRTAV